MSKEPLSPIIAIAIGLSPIALTVAMIHLLVEPVTAQWIVLSSSLITSVLAARLLAHGRSYHGCLILFLAAGLFAMNLIVSLGTGCTYGADYYRKNAEWEMGRLKGRKPNR